MKFHLLSLEQNPRTLIIQARAKSHTYPVSIPFLLHLINYNGERIIWVTLPGQWSGEDETVLYRFEISENQLQFALLLPGFANR